MATLDGDSPGAPSDSPNIPKTQGKNHSVSGNHTVLQPAPVHPALLSRPNVMALLRALRRRWLQALVLGVVIGAGMAAAGWFLIPPGKLYTRSLVHMVAWRETPEGSRLPFYHKEIYQDSQVALIKSRMVLNAALNRPEVKSLAMIRERTDAVLWLEKKLKVDFATFETLRIAMNGDDAKELETLVNAITKVYLEEVVNKEYSQRKIRQNQLDATVRNWEQKILNKRTQLENLVRQSGVNSSQVVGFQQQLTLSQLDDFKRQLISGRSDIRRLQVRIAFAEANLGLGGGGYGDMLLYGSFAPGLPVNLALGAVFKDQTLREKLVPMVQVPEDLLEDFIEQDPEIKKLIASEKSLKRQIEALKRVDPSGTSSMEVLHMQKSLKKAQKDLEEKRRELGPKMAKNAESKTRLDSKASLAKLKNELGFLLGVEKMVEQEVAVLTREKHELGNNALNLDEFRDDIKRWEEMVKKVSDQIDLLEGEARVPPRMSLREEAVTYVPDENTRKLVAAGAAGFGSLLFVLLGLAWWEFLSRKVGSPDEVVHELGMKLVGTLPDFGYRPRRKTDHYWDSVLTDSVDALRTVMLFTARTDGMRVVLVTSAVAGEGKTSSATHLAASLARSGRKTLLIDCDLRNPNAHRLFGIERGPGFSEILRGQIDIADAIQPTHVDGLSVIAAGQGNMQAIQALAMDPVGVIFAKLRLEYDFIVIDSSPILPVPDSLLLAQHSDAVIFSILREVSRVPKVYAAYQRLSMLGIRILGAVVSGTRDEVYTGSYSYVIQQ